MVTEMGGSMLKKLFCFTALSLLIFTFSQSASNDTFEFKVGNVSVTAIADSTVEMQSELIKNADADELKKYMPSGKKKASVNVFLVKTEKQIILIDAGMGDGGKLISIMKKAKITPDMVNLILITHGHFDHVAGLIKNGKAVFPNAEIMISKDEKPLYEDSGLEKIPAEYKKYFVPANQMLKLYSSKIKTFSFGDKVADGIKSVDMRGHTPGHAGFLLESNGEKLLFAGDFMHIQAVQLIHPEYSLVYDTDLDKAAKMRKKLLKKFAEDKINVAAAHIDFPGVGSFSKTSDAFAFTSLKK